MYIYARINTYTDILVYKCIYRQSGSALLAFLISFRQKTVKTTNHEPFIP